jgi:hypothetical protein
LKIDLIGHEHDAMRRSLSFSVHCGTAASAAPGISIAPAAALRPAPAVLKKSRLFSFIISVFVVARGEVLESRAVYT